MMELFARTSGTWINIAAVAAGTAVGVAGGARLPERLGRTLMQVLGLVTLFVGLGMARMLDGVRSGPLPGVIVALVSLALGALAGEALGIEERLAQLGEAARRRLGGGGRFTEGFVTASLLFCIGPMAIVGSLQNGLALDDVNAFIAGGEPTVELKKILSNLAARGLSDFVKVDYHVIRGLAYYTGVVFEAFDRKGEFRAIAGGGRYDNLITLISGGKVNLPALGFGMGDVVLLELLKARGTLPRFDTVTDVFCLIEDEGLRPQSLKLVHDLRAAGFAVDYSLTPAKPDKQFKRAQELKASFTARLENDAYVRIRNLKTRDEIVAGVNDVVNHIR